MRCSHLIFVGIILLTVALGYPVHNAISRLCLLGGLAALWWLPVCFGHILRWRRYVLLSASGLLIVTYLPGWVSPDVVRAAYDGELRRLEGAGYHWGGESPIGIDCSGLPRRALRQALWKQGLRHLSGAAFRLALSNWWHDVSARDLAGSDRDLTVPLGVSGTIQEITSRELTKLRVGDLAVTANGAHLLVYLDEGEWIHADPSQRRVVIVHGLHSRDPWLRKRVTLHRWRCLRE